MDYKIVKLNYGTLRIYSLMDEFLYCYETKDPIQDQVILFKKKDTLISIEAPLFKNNVSELNDYVKTLDVTKEYIVLVDHVSPKDYLPNATLLTTSYSLNSLRSGGPKGLFDNFRSIFKDAIQSELKDDYLLVENVLNLDDLNIKVVKKGEDFDVYFTSFKAVYTHMLGHDVHSIIGGDVHADLFLKELNSFKENDIQLILTSHYIPETITDVDIKISYIKDIKTIASSSKNKEEFIAKVKDKYSTYSGDNYLDITASSYFKN